MTSTPAIPQFPDVALLARRTAHDRVPLPVVRGALPDGLSGHLFVMTPVGTVDSGGAPYPHGNARPTVLNGDGMVWRFDFARGAAGVEATVSSRIVMPPDYVFDALTADGTPLEKYGFGDVGMLRASVYFGTRNFANTALVPLVEPGQPTRLLCCYDAGPPVEIDPATLETLEVVGESWDAEALDDVLPFPPILATAHPMWDPRTRQLYAVNYGRSTVSMIESVPLFERLSKVPDRLNDALGRLAAILGKAPPVRGLARAVGRGATWLGEVGKGLRARAGQVGELAPKSFLDLVVWPGRGDIKRLRVVDLATGNNAVIEESVHQIAVTRRYVLLLDTNFKLRFEQFYNNPFPWAPELERLFRTALASEQGTVSNLWIIRRDAVDAALARGGALSVPAFAVPLPGAVHFLADYDDAAGLRIQCAHGNALDIGEWIRVDDQRLSGAPVRPAMHGMVPAPIDVSELGQYVIDPAQRRVTERRRIAGDDLWGIALYAARDVPAWGAIPERLRHAFWFSIGLWDDTYTLFMRALYEEYEGRAVPLDAVDRLVRQGGMPSTLMCVDLESFEVCDRYTFAPGVALSSPQFVPARADADDDRGGWVTTVVWTQEAAFLWVFDAADLARGPIAELALPVLGFSLHSAWLPTIASTPRAATPTDPEALLARRIERLKPEARRRLRELQARRGR